MSKQKIKIKLNRDGIRTMLKSQEMLNICEQAARNRYGKNVDTYVGVNRVNASGKSKK